MTNETTPELLGVEPAPIPEAQLRELILDPDGQHPRPAIRDFDGTGTWAVYARKSPRGEFVGIADPATLARALAERGGVTILDGTAMHADGSAMAEVRDYDAERERRNAERIERIDARIAELQARRRKLVGE